jgi:large subunit ribosomal protein L23
MDKNIIVRPLITEKAEKKTEKLLQYTFVVAKNANKIEIKKAVQDIYNVTVESVNTFILPAKLRTRNTRGGSSKGLKPAYKKAIVRLVEGEEIDFFSSL